MQISLKWVNELVNLEKINLEDLINKLTLGGFEVEEIIEINIEDEKITALDISATANRSDSLSIQGLSLEIAALLNVLLINQKYLRKVCPWSKQLDNLQLNSIKNRYFSDFVALTVENLKDFTSPKWLQQKLIASNIKPENNILDFQNYITLETGYPFEVYDLEKIYSKLNQTQFQLTLKPAKNLENFLASNEILYSLDPSILMLSANDFSISIAGIISNNDSHNCKTTKSLLIEGSIFNAAKIRQESRNLGLRTNRSSRYEKSLKNTNLFDSLYRFICLLRIANPDLICKLHTFALPVPDKIKVIDLNYEKVKQVLGPVNITTKSEYEYICPEIISESLNRLQFHTEYNSTNFTWKVTIPPLRTDDIVQEIDLIEEIGRIYGFNNFLTRLPKIEKIGLEDIDYQVRKKLTSCLTHLGLNELIQYSLVNEELYLKNDIQLINPLIKDYSNLRSSLLPNLLKTVEENLKKGNTIVEGFEYGHIFSASSSLIVEETESVAGIFGGTKLKSNWSESARELTWFEAKGKMDQLFKKLNILTYWKSYIPVREKNILHLYCTAEILLTNGNKLGIFGKVSPLLAKKLNIPVDTYLFELNFEMMKNQLQENKLTIYQDYSLYPRIIKDLSFIVSKDITFYEIRKLLFLNGSRFLKEINLLDEYRGKSIPQNQTSLCLQLVFQSDAETLQSNKVETIIINLTKLLKKNFNATIRI